VIGVGFALYGVALIVYGTLRARAVERSREEGRYALPSDSLLDILTVSGAILGIATAAVIIFD
jgi:hypothetical protein